MPGTHASLYVNDQVFIGESFGYKKNVSGEVVFQTGMYGYVEALTDPSYRGQILVLTYPLQGNYGIPKDPLESSRIQVQGLVVSHLCQTPSHPNCIRTLCEWLEKEKVPGIFGVDTRSITLYLREFGTARGKLILNSDRSDVEIIDEKGLMNLVSQDVSITRYGQGEQLVLLIDTGCKNSIIRSLLERNVSIIRVPSHENWEKYLPEVDGIVLTNGPGDPRDATQLIDRLKPILSLGIPVFGICLGHQLIALAAGGQTEKMKYGHRSINQPVQDLFTQKCYLTSQNHGYMVNSKSLSRNWLEWFVNLNDGSNEGLYHQFLPIFSVQFHPEASPGPQDTCFLFDHFVKVMCEFQRLKIEKQLSKQM